MKGNQEEVKESVSPTVVMTSMGELAWGNPEKSGPMLAKITSVDLVNL